MGTLNIWNVGKWSNKSMDVYISILILEHTCYYIIYLCAKYKSLICCLSLLFNYKCAFDV